MKWGTHIFVRFSASDSANALSFFRVRIYIGVVG